MLAAIFLACAILAVVFFLYALAQFVREERRLRRLHAANADLPRATLRKY